MCNGTIPLIVASIMFVTSSAPIEMLERHAYYNNF